MTNFRPSIFRFIAILLLTATEAKSQELVRPVITGVPFLQIIPDARSGGMGGTGVATVPDAYSQFHNPAKFLFMEPESRGFGISYIPQFIGYANDIFLANVVYFEQLNDHSAVSGSMTYFNYGDVRLEEEMGGLIIHQGNFTPNEFAVDASYSLKLGQNFGMSVTGRYIRSDITSSRMSSLGKLRIGHAVAVDISGYYRSTSYSRRNEWAGGFMLKNIGSQVEYSNETGYGYPLPTLLKIGGGYHIARGRQERLSFYAEVSKYLVPASDDQRGIPNHNILGGIFHSFVDAPAGFSEEFKELILHLGTEMKFNNNFRLRTGYFTQHREKGYKNHLSFGVGMPWRHFVFDFAYQFPISSYLSLREDNVLKFSISIDMDSLDPEVF